MLMREWLLEQIDAGEIPGLEWLDDSKTLIRYHGCMDQRLFGRVITTVNFSKTGPSTPVRIKLCP